MKEKVFRVVFSRRMGFEYEKNQILHEDKLLMTLWALAYVDSGSTFF